MRVNAEPRDDRGDRRKRPCSNAKLSCLHSVIGMAAILVLPLRLDCAAMPGRHCPSKTFFSRRSIAQAEIRGQASIPRDHVPTHTVARFWISTAGQNASLTPNWISRFGLAAVKPSGWLGERLAVPCTLNGGANCEPTMLFTLA
jgi:hypothetical protein